MIRKNLQIVIPFVVTSALFMLAFLLPGIHINLHPSPVAAARYQLGSTTYTTSTIPGLMTYQGTLSSDTGAPINGNMQLTFRVYSTTNGGSAFWTETHPNVAVEKGYFDVLLGESNPFPEDLFAEPARYLGIQVGNSPEMAPRQRITGVAYALEANHSQTADRLAGLPVSSLAPITHTHTFTCPPRLRFFQEVFTLPTQAASKWEFFTLGEENYLMVANQYNGSSFNVDSRLYHWNGSVFTPVQIFATHAVIDWEFFTIGNDAYLVVANYYDGSNYNTNSRIYRWNGTSFNEFQSIPTQGAQDWEFFTLNGDSYLAVAHHFNGSIYNIDSKLYRWNGTTFTPSQSIPTQGAMDWEFFTINGDSYLAVANLRDLSTYNINSKIYRWNGTTFTEFQSIPTQGAIDLEFFTLDNSSYLAIANHHNGTTYSLSSKIYRWNGMNFTEFQNIPTQGAFKWEFFTLGSDAYLTLANFSNDSTSNINSKLYRWNGTTFDEFQNIPTYGAKQLAPFTMNGVTYLAIADYYNGSTYNFDSPIHRAMLEECGSVGLPIAPPGEYLQLNPVQSAPPDADCDEVTERGRAKVDVVNGILYLCTNSGWIAK